MKDYKSLNHTRWDCKYHIVFIPKRRKKIIYGRLRKYFGDIFHQLAKQPVWVNINGVPEKSFVDLNKINRISMIRSRPMRYL